MKKLNGADVLKHYLKQRYVWFIIGFTLASFLIGITTHASTATVSLRIPCTNQNWEHSPRCTAPVETFTETTDGFYGTLTSGVEFKQTRITPYLHLFQAEQMKWLVYNGKIAYLD